MHENLPRIAQSYPNMLKTARIWPKTISLRNYEILPKIEILVLFYKKIQYVEEASKRVPTVLIFNTRISHMPFLLLKKDLYM
jgi:hypothetical protein